MRKILIIRAWLAAAFACTVPQNVQALDIEFRYDYDAVGFFDRPGAVEALEAAAAFFESKFHDSLLGINPAVHGGQWSARIPNIQNPFSGQIVSVPGLIVPEDTIVIFVGSSIYIPPGRATGGAGGYQNLGGSSAWSQRLAARGEAGALTSPPTDFGPWGGFISFSAGDNWDFSLDSNNPPMVSFVTAAIHEISHVMGFGTAASWNAQRNQLSFLGANAMASFGGPVPLDQEDSLRAHWRDDLGGCKYPLGYTPGHPNNVLSRTLEAFGTPHGHDQIALMDLRTCIAGGFIKVLTDLDIAALADIGWEVTLPQRLSIAGVSGGVPELRWSSSSLFDYRIESSPTLAAGSWQTVHETPGNGAEMNFTPEQAGSTQGFYRMEAVPRGIAAAAALEFGGSKVQSPAKASSIKLESMPVIVTSCACHPGE